MIYLDMSFYNYYYFIIGIYRKVVSTPTTLLHIK